MLKADMIFTTLRNIRPWILSYMSYDTGLKFACVEPKPSPAQAHKYQKGQAKLEHKNLKEPTMCPMSVEPESGKGPLSSTHWHP